MGDAAVKDPSMEDILASIRKIISEEEQQKEPSAAAVNEAVSGEPAASEPMDHPHAEPVYADMPGSTLPSEEEVLAGMKEEAARKEAGGEEASSDETMALEGELSSGMPVTEQPLTPPAPPAAASMNHDQTVPPPQASPEPEMRHPVQSREEEPAQSEAPRNRIEADGQPLAAERAAFDREAEEFRGALMSPSTDGAVSDSFERLKRASHDDLDAKTESLLRPMLREWLDENLPTLVERLVREEIERVARGT